LSRIYEDSRTNIERPPKKRRVLKETMAARAIEYRALMEAEPGMSRADLACRLGVSRAWVTRVLGPQCEVRDVTAEAV
jgi:hypothetical protein